MEDRFFLCTCSQAQRSSSHGEFFFRNFKKIRFLVMVRKSFFGNVKVIFVFARHNSVIKSDRLVKFWLGQNVFRISDFFKVKKSKFGNSMAIFFQNCDLTQHTSNWSKSKPRLKFLTPLLPKENSDWWNHSVTVFF